MPRTSFSAAIYLKAVLGCPGATCVRRFSLSLLKDLLQPQHPRQFKTYAQLEVPLHHDLFSSFPTLKNSLPMDLLQVGVYIVSISEIRECQPVRSQELHDNVSGEFYSLAAQV
ncbi:hypothetical protein HETIRDRAFT_327230 [Heterobasidion irregulare TC 32-1]|uniref:Uncharacterized protein n=1 Tax=Heterobasidion irregulare (strain TC 32-1) TaxID=747525 RepID=W4JVP0_HETIT|nr:uncharacterized protein HETIRDRAFT_326437 [Heterobasidion irregulare TC 32-1]XP_009550711.1 uncharacterized protein HETIRDRAFT_327230 [Heterobasidion irregulare TC 32-1]ETW77145.1 hypothetical protein HETIRDRAFT_326437 [Heterobasidion irregulare TC 32-1]ETW77169.1 hypothetical protein HETIRDRAFT_327230 [Heterobasidion irregulare TC 32-1]